MALPGRSRKLDLNQILGRLSEKAVKSLLVEGGGSVLTSFLEGGLADKILLTVSPRLIGGVDGPSIFGGRGAEDLNDALRLKMMSSFRIDEDLILEGYF
jgi:diaminohydroxyphosphoribosylaminopyrimidine deaminase/5-amino-6-(5-phosphoribosylamino)uracil reductase